MGPWAEDGIGNPRKGWSSEVLGQIEAGSTKRIRYWEEAPHPGTSVESLPTPQPATHTSQQNDRSKVEMCGPAEVGGVGEGNLVVSYHPGPQDHGVETGSKPKKRRRMDPQNVDPELRR